jgi:tRNA A-37 threonylcarbamoyl transferase component Bud32
MSKLSPAAAASAGAPPSGAGPDELVYGQIAEEVNACLQAGREPDVAALAARYPQLGGQVRELVGALLALRQLGPEGLVAASGGRPLPPEAAVLGCLGDFQILREVGRGGMGVVYEAQQLSLGRRVALKVLPFAAALDARQLQRFKNEAQAAAQLHHTHIVPVYFVGCERGVHFYAMQYIDGHTLAALIAELRRHAGRDKGAGNGGTGAAGASRPEPTAGVAAPADPGASTTAAPLPPFVRPASPWPLPAPAPAVGASTLPGSALATIGPTQDAAFFRGVARLGVQAAEALEHAHQQGVIHRDIKPANLLLEQTPLAHSDPHEGPRLWVTDFGLAQVLTDTRLTLTGDLVGTLRS